ncbi:MAG: efflux transporter outer membrane subunit [Gemmatimonadota bacterium]
MRILPAAAVLIAAGCASAPGVQRPGMEVTPPAAWSAGPAGPAAPFSGAAWWRPLADARAAALVDLGLEHNYDLAAAAARVEGAMAQARVAGAPRWPQVQAGADVARSKRNFVGFPIGGGAGGVPSSTTSAYGASLSSTWEADLWGRLRDGQQAALAEAGAAAADLEGARLSLTAQILRTYFGAVEAGRQLALADSAVAAYRLSEQQIGERYARGLRPALDLRLARANRAAAESVRAARARALDAVRRQLELLVGRYPAGAVEVGAELPEALAPVPVGMPAELVARRPDLAAAERRLAAAGARVGEARKALYPRLSLTASGGRSSDELSSLLDGDYSVWNLVANLSVPLFQGGRLRAAADLAASGRDAALAQYAGRVLVAFGEVERSLVAEQLLAEQQAAAAEATTEAVAARELAQERYNAGLADLIALLEAQRRAYEAESQLLAVRRQRLEARIDLNVALGGDFGQPDAAPGTPPN